MTLTEEAATPPVRITVVESPACHFCADAHEVLEALARSYPLAVQTLDVRGETGRQLMSRHRASMSPLVLVDGEFFSHGRLPRRKLDKMLSQRYGAPAVSPRGGLRRG